MDQVSSLSHVDISSTERTEGVDNELPTYNEVARDPNFRFGRWKAWIEKRAAERYADDTPEKRLARQLKGWGPQAHIDYQTQDDRVETPISPATTLHRTQTVLSHPSDIGTQPMITHEVHCEALSPSHATLCTFGSRFIPHAEYPILSLLPILNEKRFLIGHSRGLCVLDMDSELSDLNTKEPRRYDIFFGEGFHQMDILELEEATYPSAPNGIVLALVGTEFEGESDRDNRECGKTIRMYNLAGLMNLAQWACDTKGKEPLDLCQGTSFSDTRKRKSRLKTASVDLSNLVMSRQSSSFIPSMADTHRNSIALDNDIADTTKLPLRWATDYVSVAMPGSRLNNQNILFYTLQRCKERSRVTTRLAVATKQSVVLYETLRGERSFRYVKEFYTPAFPRSITFIHQRPLLSPKINDSEYSARGLTASAMSWLRSSQINSSAHYGQLSLFITFDKKACLIRILDSSVTELEMWNEARQTRRASSMSRAAGTQKAFPLSRNSFEGQTSISKEPRATWLSPVEISLPSIGKTLPVTETLTVYLLTRGQLTHIVPAPLIVPLNIYSPLKILKWDICPRNIVARLCQRPLTGEPFLQVTALGQEGLEIQEFSLGFLDPSTSKEKTPEPSVVVQADVGPGGAGFLRMGGHWNKRGKQIKRGKEKALPPLPLHRDLSKSTIDTLDLHEKKNREQGFYAWARKGYSDWRVFWVGGDAEDGPPPTPVTP